MIFGKFLSPKQTENCVDSEERMMRKFIPLSVPLLKVDVEKLCPTLIGSGANGAELLRRTAIK